MERVSLKEWIAALRSGEYQQGQELLHPGDKFCCLGVYCDLTDPSWTISAENVATWHTDYRDFVPHEFIEISTQEYLAEFLNDAGHSFGEIADWLEKNAAEDGTTGQISAPFEALHPDMDAEDYE